MSLSLHRRWLLGILLFAAAVPSVNAQEEKDDKEKKAIQDLIQRAEDEYRQFFKRPENGIQFWGAIKFEMDTGKYDLAAFHIQELLKLPAEKADPDLLKVEKAEGLNAFLRLQTVRQWHKNEKLQAEAEKNIQTLIGRVSAALEKHLSDPVRLDKFIKQLDAPTTEERTFAFVELARSRERAVPYLVQALRTNVGTPLYGKIREAMVRLEPEIVPPLLEILRAADAKDALEMDVRPTVLDIIRRRSDKRAIPYLWHLSEAKQYPEPLRKQARVLLSQLLETDISLLAPSKNALTELGEKYFQHRVKFKSGAGVRLWPWDGDKIPLKPTELSPTAAEEYFAKRYAREALDLDAAYQPAQRLLLSVTLERGFNRNVDEFILKPMPPDHHQLLATIDAELLAQVLERALEDGNVPVILPAVQALGERGDARAARLGAGGAPRGLMRALYYPDRRVQFVALRAALKMPNHPGPAASMRIVDLLRRFVAAEGKPKALLAYIPDEQAADARKAVAELGFEPVLVKNVRAGFEKLQATADFDVLMLGSAIPEKELPYVLAQLRGDADHGRLPLVVFTPKEKQEAVARQLDRHRLAKILPDSFLTSGEELKGALELFLQDGSMAVSSAERKEINRVAMDILWRMARGEITGYDVRPAQDTVVQALRSPDLAVEAVEILGRLPGREPQTRLAGLVTDAGQSKLRMPAAIELNRSVQKYGLLLDKNQVKDLKSAFQAAKADDPVRAQLALFLGNLRTTPAATGQQLSNFRPDPPAPPKKDKEKEKEKEKDEK